MSGSRLIGHSGFVDSCGCFVDADSNNIQKEISLVIILMWNDSAACSGRMCLKMFMKDLSEG